MTAHLFRELQVVSFHMVQFFHFKGEAARNEVDEHGPDGAEPYAAMGTKAFVLGRLQRTGDKF